MARYTPPLKAKGIYTLSSPFPDVTTKVYQCIAIRSFQDYLDLGQDLLAAVYTPNGLNQSDYDNDLAEGACIVTLTSDTDPMILVPDTYIQKYPDLEYVPYHTLVLSAALGPLPDSLSLELLKTQVAGIISDVIGVTPVVNIHATGATGVVTVAQHAINEQTRNSAVSNRITDRAKLIAANALILSLQSHISSLEDAIINNP